MRIIRLLPVMMVCMWFNQMQAATISISCGAVGQEFAICKEGAESWAARTNNKVRVVSTPNSSSERLALYQQLLAAQSKDVDVFQIDVVWPGILASHFIDLRAYTKKQLHRHFPAIISNNTVDGRLVAIPWFTDAGLLYYRADLLKKYGRPVPETWSELAETARFIQHKERAAGQQRMWGFVWQGRAYEGLTCNGLEWLTSYGGGTIINQAGQITVNNPRAAQALTTAASWVGDISPPGVLNYAEEEARSVFQSGLAVFMRNWPYAWALAQSDDSPIQGKVGLARLPRGNAGGIHAATLGGWQLAVSRYSQHPDLAADLVMYLTAPAEQKRRAIQGTYNPTIPALYQDPEILEINPFFSHLYETFVTATPRPSTVSGIHYNRTSSLFWNGVHRVLAGKSKAKAALNKLEKDLERQSLRNRR